MKEDRDLHFKEKDFDKIIKINFWSGFFIGWIVATMIFYTCIKLFTTL